MADELPVEYFPDRESFATWLREHHTDSPGIWVKLAKKGSAHPSVSYAEVVEELLCHGWIDSQARRLDDDFRLQRITPRRVRSPWSQRNRELVERLEAEGRLSAAGAAEVARARADGRWERAYAGQATAQVPQDFLDALADNPAARAFYDTLDGRNRFAIAYRLQAAKRPETRARRIETFVQQLAEGRRFHDQPGRTQ
ncbi:YdeI/OmpD-associated family protein [Rhodococcus indonesiensis]|uniref:YdeI/OmpD-associated family protein n=1 Tax=Rhodococcus indonesiensis TaxID=3055869 RepID=UPI0039F668A1